MKWGSGLLASAIGAPRMPNMFDAGLPAIDRDAVTNPDEALAMLMLAREQAPIPIISALLGAVDSGRVILNSAVVKRDSSVDGQPDRAAVEFGPGY